MSHHSLPLIPLLACLLVTACQPPVGETTPPVDDPTSDPSPSEKSIISFSVDAVNAEISDTNIIISLPEDSPVDALVPYFSASGTSVKVGGVEQVSGVTANDFSQPVTYAVTAKDGSSRNYSVSVAFHPAAWEIVGTRGFTGGDAWQTSVAFSPAGRTYLAATDFAASGNITVFARLHSGTAASGWEVIGARGFGDGNLPELSFDALGVAFVSMTDSNHDGSKVMKFNGTAWTQVGSGFSSGGPVRWNAPLAFDATNTPCVVFDDGAHSRHLTVAKLVGDTWVPVGGAGFSAGWATSPSITAGQGTLFVAYNDFSGTPEDTHALNGGVVMKLVGDAWQQVGPTIAAGFNSSHTLAFDASGVLYGAWADGVRRLEGNAWVTVGTGAGHPAGLAVRGTRLTIFGTDGSSQAVVKTFRSDTGAWVTAGNAAASSEQAWWPSMALDGLGHPYLVYGEGGSQDIKAVMVRLH